MRSARATELNLTTKKEILARNLISKVSYNQKKSIKMNSIPNFLSRSSQTFQSFLRIVPWSSWECRLVQWNWFFDVTECTRVSCIQWRQRTNFTAPGCIKKIPFKRFRKKKYEKFHLQKVLLLQYGKGSRLRIRETAGCMHVRCVFSNSLDQGNFWYLFLFYWQSSNSELSMQICRHHT